MSNYFNKLFLSCRNLGLVIRKNKKEPDTLLIDGDRKLFPSKLYNLAKVLEEIDENKIIEYNLQNELLIESMFQLMKKENIDSTKYKELHSYFKSSKKKTISKELLSIIREREQFLRLVSGVAPRQIKIR